MGLPAASISASRKSPEILFTEDRKIGSLGGLTRRPEVCHATQAASDRWAEVQQPLLYGDRSGEVIAACIEVHRQLGPGLLEGIYEACLCRELTLRGLRYERQRAVSVEYKGTAIDQGYRIDLIVEGELLVEVKSIECLLPVHSAQVVTYLRVTGLATGLLVNFNALTIRDGLRRLSRNPKSFRSSDLL